MEAASANPSSPLVRDGTIPGTAPAAATALGDGTRPIDGVIRCASCERYPLVGERVTHHSGRGDGAWLCDACEASGRGKRIGPVDAVERVRSLGGAMNVRRAA